jgi:copper chaperone NosL
MTIVDKQHASEFVTRKGKVYKFDASECMINFIRDIERTTVALYLVNDYNNPGVLVDAKQATYLISENIPSPMGAYLTAFNSREEAELARESNKGILLTWEELNQKFED